MLSRRYIAFMSNVDAIANGKNRKLHLWTFTFADAVDVVELRTRWNKLLTYLRRWNPRWSGVRVYEMHPGKWGWRSHGVHVHVITNERFDITGVLKCVKQAGWGRTNVTKVPYDRRFYAGKYLNKARTPCLKGWRLMACFNLPAWSRLRDIVLNSTRSRLFRHCAGMSDMTGNSWDQMPWHHKLEMVAAAEWSVIARGLVWCPEQESYLSPLGDPFRFRRPVPLLLSVPPSFKPARPADSPFLSCQ